MMSESVFTFSAREFFTEGRKDGWKGVYLEAVHTVWDLGSWGVARLGMLGKKGERDW